MAYMLRVVLIGVGMYLYLAGVSSAVNLPSLPLTPINTWNVQVMCTSQEEEDHLSNIKTRGDYVTQQSQWLKIAKRLNLSPEIFKAVNFDQELIIFSSVPVPNHIGWQNPQLTNDGELTFWWASTKVLGAPNVYGVNFTFYKLSKRPRIHAKPILKINGIAVRH